MLAQDGAPDVNGDPPATFDAGAPSPPLDTPRGDRSTFAAIYQAAAPQPADVRAALSRLRTCSARGLISSEEYTSIQAALVARL